MRVAEFILESLNVFPDWPQVIERDGQVHLIYIRGHEDNNQVKHLDGSFKEISAEGKAHLDRRQQILDRDNAITQENFADGKKPGRKGLAKRSGVNTKASVSSLRKTAKNSSGEKQRMAHWLANMKAGRAKKK